MYDDIDRELSAQVYLGEKADTFWRDDLGKYIIARILEDIESAVEKLKTVSPVNSKKIIMHQNRIAIAEAVPRYFNELIIEGKQALGIISEGETDGE